MYNYLQCKFGELLEDKEMITMITWVLSILTGLLITYLYQNEMHKHLPLELPEVIQKPIDPPRDLFINYTKERQDNWWTKQKPTGSANAGRLGRFELKKEYINGDLGFVIYEFNKPVEQITDHAAARAFVIKKWWRILLHPTEWRL